MRIWCVVSCLALVAGGGCASKGNPSFAVSTSAAQRVLGEMRELGGSAAEEHRAVGVLAHELGIDKVLVVGDGARGVYDALVELRGDDGTTRHVDTVDEAGAWLRKNVSGPDAVLVKASRSGRLERVAEELVAERPGEESGR